MKKILAIMLCMMLLIPSAGVFAEEDIDITLWTYPVGNWGNEETVNGIIENFNSVHPNIRVTVQYLDYQSGDDSVISAIEAKTTPDIILEGPERLVANWGAAGKMLDITDLWEYTKEDIVAASPAVEAACKNAEGVYYEYPLCMTTHCMAINYNDFEKADALKYLDEETRTWTTEGFVNACRALHEAGFDPVGIVYCGGQGGDQGTRALVTNLYSGQFTNEDHSAYTMDSEENIKALKLIKQLVDEGVLAADPGIVAGDEIAMFCNSTASMSFCWNASAAVSNKASLADDVKVFPMAFPSDDGVPELQGGIWGFGLFDNGDEKRAEAARTFVKFVCDDPSQAKDSVYATGFFPTRASLGDVYEGTEKAENAEYAIFMPYLGDYYQVTPQWARQRTEWWNLLQRIFESGDVEAEVAVYMQNANAD
jgi:multiple sugar transport system substrate-binding protein